MAKSGANRVLLPTGGRPSPANFFHEEALGQYLSGATEKVDPKQVVRANRGKLFSDRLVPRHRGHVLNVPMWYLGPNEPFQSVNVSLGCKTLSLGEPISRQYIKIHDVAKIGTAMERHQLHRSEERRVGKECRS